MFNQIVKFLEWLNPKVVRNPFPDRLEEPVYSPPKPKHSLYKDKTGKWRWRIIATNGEVIGASTEGYSNKSSCEKNLYLITNLKLKKQSP